jgi:preprotein translocase subunit SecF
VSFRTAVATFRGHRQPHFNIIGRWKVWFALSGVFIILSLIGLFAIGLNYSIDFKGGAQLRYPNPGKATVGDVDRVLSKYGRGDAEVQVVGTDNGGSQIVIRTRSLNDLGGPPQTQFTLPGSTASRDDLNEAMAEFGLVPKIHLTNRGATVVVEQGAPGRSHGVTVVYKPSTPLTVEDVQKTMSSLGRPGAHVDVINGTVIIKTPSLTAPPPPSPSPTSSVSPTATSSPSAGESPTAASSPSAGESGAPSAAAAAAAPTKKAAAPGSKASPKASANPSPSAQPTASSQPSPTAAPTATPSTGASPTPTGPPSAQDILDALSKQAGIQSTDITVNQLSKATTQAVAAALAQRAGIQPTQVVVKDIGGDERARLLSELANQAGIGTDEIVINDVGPTWGSQISSKAIKGLIIFLVLVTLYISFRFEWKMAVSALTALAHDLIITAGIYALVGREVTPETVIAILTILGYSLYDTVVIFDRVKENTESLALVARDGYSNVVNLSLNETLMRSVNTSLVVLLPILSLLLFGGDTLKDFAFALFIGVASGTYSSIFIASPMLALLKEREPRYAQMRLRATRAASRGQGQVAAVGATAAGRAPARTTTSRTTTTTAKAPKATSASTSNGGPGGDGEVAQPAPAKSASQAKSGSGSGGRTSGGRPGGGSSSRSRSKKRTPPAKRRRR